MMQTHWIFMSVLLSQICHIKAVLHDIQLFNDSDENDEMSG